MTEYSLEYRWQTVTTDAAMFLDDLSFEPITYAARLGFHYWKSKFDGAMVPHRASIDPVEIPRLLPHLMLVDVVRAQSGLDFRIRLMGERQVEMVGQNMTGKFLSEVDVIVNDQENISEIFTTTCEKVVPHYWIRKFIFPDKSYRKYERVLLPLRNDDDEIGFLFSIVSFLPLTGD